MKTFFLKRGNSRPEIVFELDDTVPDLTGSIIRAGMRQRNGGAIPLANDATWETINGVRYLKYNVAAADTATIGTFEFEFDVYFVDGENQTFPAQGYIRVVIAEDILPQVAVLFPPAPFTAGQWALADSPSAGGDTLAITLSSIPAGTTSVRVSINGEPDILLTGAPATGTPYTITVPATMLAGVSIIAANASGASAASAIKTATPTAVVTAPAAFTAEQWALANSPSPGGDTLTVNILALPANGGAAISALQFRRNGAGATVMTGVGTGERNISVLAGAPADIQVRAVNASGEGPWSDTKTETPTSGLQATHGSVVFTYSGAARTTFNSFDGAAGIVIPDGGSVQITGVTPPTQPDVDFGGTPYDLSGVEIDPLGRNGSNAGLHAFDQRLDFSSQYDAGLMASFPATLSNNQKIVKCVSDLTVFPGQQPPRKGIAAAYGVLNVTNQTNYNAMQAAGGVSNWIAPTPFTWAGRAAHTWRRMNMDALFALRPGLSFTSINFPAGITLATEVARLDRYNAGLLANNSTSPPGSYEGHQLNDYWKADTNYGSDAAMTARYIAMHFLGTTPRAEIEPAIRRLATLGSWWFDAEKGRFDDAGLAGQTADGGHWSFMFIPMIFGLLATGRESEIPNLFTVSPMNQGQMPRTLSASDVLQLAKHTNNANCYAYRQRLVTAIAGSTLNVTVTASDPTWCKFNQLECRKASDDTLIGYVRSMPGIDEPGTGAGRAITLDRTVTGLVANTDSVYFAAPAAWGIVEGVTVWTIDGTMKNYSPSPVSEYLSLNNYAGDIFFLRAMGRYSSAFAKLEAFVKRCVYLPALPSPEIDPLSTVVARDAAGAIIPGAVKNSDQWGAGQIGVWIRNIWNAHAASVGLGNTGGALSVNSVLPTITGTIQAGQTVTISTGTWSNSPSSYALTLSNGGTATGTGPWTYVLPTGLVGTPLIATVVANNTGGASVPAASLPTVPVQAATTASVFLQMDNLTDVTFSENVTGTIVGSPGTTRFNGNGGPSTLYRKANFPLPSGMAQTDLLVVASDAQGPMLMRNTALTLNVGSYAYRTPVGSNAANPPGNGTSGTGAVEGLVYTSKRLGEFRLTDYAGQRLDQGTVGSTHLLAMNTTFSENAPGTLRVGPIYRVTASPNKPMVAFTFDDCNPRQATTLLTEFSARNFKASLGIGSGFLARPAGTTITAADCAMLRDTHGWAMCLNSGPLDQTVMGYGTIADALAALQTEKDTLIGMGITSEEEMRYLIYSNGVAACRNTLLAGTVTVAGAVPSTNLSFSLGANGAGLSYGQVVRGLGAGASGDPVIVRSNGINNFIVDRPVNPGTYPNARIVGLIAKIACVTNNTTTVTGINTRGIMPGMVMLGKNIPTTPATTIVSIVTESTGTASDGTITVSTAVDNCTVATFYLPTVEFLPGAWNRAALAAGYKFGRIVAAGGGLYTGFGIDPLNTMTTAAFDWESQATAGAHAISRHEADLRNKCDVFPLSHWTTAATNDVATMAQYIIYLDWVAARRDAGELDVVTLPEWYARASNRARPT